MVQMNDGGAKVSRTFEVEELQERFPSAWAALPEPYQSDHCVEFFLSWTLKGRDAVLLEICCRPKDEEMDILGDWTAKYDERAREWLPV